jgi:hypothetical protein
MSSLHQSLVCGPSSLHSLHFVINRLEKAVGVGVSQNARDETLNLIRTGGEGGEKKAGWARGSCARASRLHR